MAKKRKLALFRGDKSLWIIVTALLLTSLLVVYSATAAMAYREVDGNTSYYLFRQVRFILVGFFMIIVVHWIDYKYYARYARTFFRISVILVILAYVVGVSLNDAARWIKLPGFGFTFQPSELLKVTLVVLLAQQLGVRQGYIARIPILPALLPSRWRLDPLRNFDIWSTTTRPLILPIVVATLVVLPSNFSTAAIIWMTCMIMMMIGRVSRRQLGRLMGVAAVGTIVLVAVMWMAGVGRAQTWVNRVVQFANPTEIVQGNRQSNQDSYQVEQAEIAIASGGVIGKGPGNSTQRSQLPHPYSDFAYAFIIEEYGILGGVVVFVLYLWIFYRAGLIVRRCNRPSQGLMVLGLSLIITMQAFVNMAVSVGLMPVTGQPLPLISLGGSSVFFTCIAMGMILGISRESDQERDREQRALEAEQAENQSISPLEDPAATRPIGVDPSSSPSARHPLFGRAPKLVLEDEDESQGTYNQQQFDDGEVEEELRIVDRGTSRPEYPPRSRTKEVIDLIDDEV